MPKKATPPETRICRACEETKSVSQFEQTRSPESPLGAAYRRVCLECRKEYWHTRMESARGSIETYATVLVLRCKSRTTKGIKQGKNYQKSIVTEGWVVHQWDLQGGLCYYSGVPMDMSPGPTLVTVERLDPKQGYAKENCVLACLCVNMMRGQIPREEFVWWCGEVAKNAPESPAHPTKLLDDT